MTSNNSEINLKDLKDAINGYEKDSEPAELGIKELSMDNMVSKKKLRHIQQSILNTLRKYISATYGPLGSNTVIITGNNKQTISANYSKDGLKVLNSITFNKPLEMAICSQLVDIAKFVEHQVGDGTTSSIILSSYIFNGLSYIEEKCKILPRDLSRRFIKIANEIKEIILSNKRNTELEDIYKIAMISTNGDTEVSNNIYDIYKKYGMDVSIDVGISNDKDSKLKIYDGLTVNEGYSDPAYINNNTTHTADIHNARVYYFRDPIDTADMIQYLNLILLENIYKPMANNSDYIPTVIISPRISRDASGLLTKLVTSLYTFNKDNNQAQKPPILIITNISGTDENIVNDIAKLCRCKDIAKFIDPENEKSAQEKFESPTPETVVNGVWVIDGKRIKVDEDGEPVKIYNNGYVEEETGQSINGTPEHIVWYGTCDLVSADADKTKFIRPAALVDPTDNTYDVLVSYLKQEIQNCKDNNADALELGRLKKRLRCLEANMVEYLIGGITISDRDAVKDLAEDAVKNCASAAANGVGYAANFEGLRASYKVYSKYKEGSIDYYIASSIYYAYYNTVLELYKSVLSADDADLFTYRSISVGHPYNIVDIFDKMENISKEDFDKQKQDIIYDNITTSCNVLCSINTDIEILDAISKIITIMVTANQVLVQTPELNRY